jgi:UDP-N-acetylmuramoylalanine-D-glutamate ligase
VKLTNKKIGIWGFGVSGQSLLRYFIQQAELPVLGILEKNLSPELQAPYAGNPNVTFYKDEPSARQQFLEHHDIIIPSPGIDLRPYAHYSEKFLAEADLFYLLWTGNPLEWFDTSVFAFGFVGHSPRAEGKNAHTENRSTPIKLTQESTDPKCTIQESARGECFSQHLDAQKNVSNHSSEPKEYVRKKIIGITGTLGKTSITHLLSILLPQAGISVATGGNIGTGMFDLLGSDADYALLELSSFQLENCKHFVADIAVITNLYPNHLDRHETMEKYAQAKFNIFARQNEAQHAVVPLENASELHKQFPHKPFAFFSSHTPTTEQLEHFVWGNRLYCCDEGTIMKLELSALTSRYTRHFQKEIPGTRSERSNTTSHKDNTHQTPIGQPNTSSAHFECFFEASQCVEKMYREVSATHKTQTLSSIPTISYPENWLIITTVLDLLGLDSEEIISGAKNLTIPDYRLEKVATIQGTSYYNDSKSTIMQATLAAVDALKQTHNNTIIVILGGTSKGVDRTPFVKKLKNNVTHVICFGAEAHELHAMCNAAGIPATAVATLEEAVALAQKLASSKTAGSQTAVVLSPGGASFDLFKDYKERGERFKQLVLAAASKG